MRTALVTVLLLTLSVSSTFAVPVDPVAPNQVAAITYDGYQIRLLRTNGEVWTYSSASYGWQHEDGTQVTTDMTLPVAVSEVADWSYWYFFTHAGMMWQCQGDGWHAVEFPPANWGVVAEQKTSLGGLKKLFK